MDQGGIKKRYLNELARREVLQRFEASATSVVEFCKREGISPSNFYRWRSLAAASPSAPAVLRGRPAEFPPASPQARFIELGALGEVGTGASGRLDLKLDLGGGLILHLVRS